MFITLRKNNLIWLYLDKAPEKETKITYITSSKIQGTSQKRGRKNCKSWREECYGGLHENVPHRFYV